MFNKNRPVKSIYDFVPLKEMAVSKSDIENRINDLNHLAIEHIVKLILFPQNKRDYKGWTISVNKSFYEVSKMKWENTNNFMPDSFYYNNYYTSRFDPFQDLIRGYIEWVIYEYPNMKPKFTTETFPYDYYKVKFEIFYRNISVLLSKGMYTQQIVFELLDDLLQR